MEKVLNTSIYTSLLKRKLRENGLNPSLTYSEEYNRNITFEQQKKINEIKVSAKKRTLELQDRFSTLDVDRNKYDREFIKDIMNR